MSDKEEMQQKIQQLQMMEQSMQQFLQQKQQFQNQLLELNSALEELKDSKESYKIVGNIMVKTDPEELKKDLNSKKEIIELRIKTIETQEEKLREKTKAAQSEIMESMNKDKK